MKYNLARYGATTCDITEGDISLSTDELIDLTRTTSAHIQVPVSGTTSGTLALEVDLGSRVHISDIKYYFDNTTSGIEIFHKNEEFEPYISLVVFYDPNYYYASLSGVDISPRYIKVKHTVVSGSGGYIDGLEILNNEDYVDFGYDGNRTNYNVNLALEDDLVEINQLEVYNSGPTKANAKLILEPQNTKADNIFSISADLDSSWHGVYNDDDMIAGPGQWIAGNMEDLYDAGTALKLSSGKTVGTYRTRIFDVEENQRLTFAILNYDYPIVSPSTEFEDDFLNANNDNKWTKITNPSYIYFRNSRLEIQGDNTRVRTTEVLKYTDDWQATFRFYVRGSGTYGSNFRAYINDTSGAYVRFIFDTAYAYGASYLMEFRTASTVKWSTTDGSILNSLTDKWVWVKIRKHFNELKFKYWPAGDAEPDWTSISTIALNEIATEGRIDFRLADDWYNYLMYIDDVSLITNFTAESSAYAFISTSGTDTTENIEVRSSNSAPLDEDTYIELYNNNSNIGIKHMWVLDGTIARNNQTISDPSGGNLSGSHYFWESYYDSVSNDTYILHKINYHTSYGWYSRINLAVKRNNGSEKAITLKSITSGSIYYSTYTLKFNVFSGLWLYYYVNDSNNSDDASAYRLDYYDSNLNRLFRKSQSKGEGSFLYDMDTLYDGNGELWYSDRSLSTIFKIDIAGNLLASYLATEDVRGLFASDDGGCWFIQGQALIKLDSNAKYVTHLDLPTTTVSYVKNDYGKGFWLHDGWIVRYLDLNGNEIFNVTVDNLLWIDVIHSGVVGKAHDGSTTVRPQGVYISKEHQRVLRTWDYPSNEGGYAGTYDYNRYGLMSHTYDDFRNGNSANLPISIDTNWNNAEWKKVAIRDYNFPNDKYHQMRVTLRADNSANSPELYGIWTQQAIEIPDIYPNSYGKFYLKSDANSLTEQDAGNYDSKVRAYWFISTE